MNPGTRAPCPMSDGCTSVIYRLCYLQGCCHYRIVSAFNICYSLAPHSLWYLWDQPLYSSTFLLPPPSKIFLFISNSELQTFYKTHKYFFPENCTCKVIMRSHPYRRVDKARLGLSTAMQSESEMEDTQN